MKAEDAFTVESEIMGGLLSCLFVLAAFIMILCSSFSYLDLTFSQRISFLMSAMAKMCGGGALGTNEPRWPWP